MECLEIGRLLVREALLPTALEDADPCEGQGAHSRLVRFPLVALRLVIDLCPEGMPDGCCGPCHERVSEERRPLQTPVHPGLLATACRHRGDARLFLEFLGGGEAFALCAKGHEETGGKDGTSPWQGINKGKSGWTWARWAMAVSKSAMACKVTRSWATRACTRRVLGAITPASVVSATACLMASMRVVMTSAERTWWARKKRSRVVRRAR